MVQMLAAGEFPDLGGHPQSRPPQFFHSGGIAMLVETKARVGVFAIALGAYLPQFPSLVPEFQSQYQTFKTMIPDSVELIDGGIVTTKELAQQAGDKFRAATWIWSSSSCSPTPPPTICSPPCGIWTCPWCW